MAYLETDRLIIRPLSRQDAASIFEYAKDPEVASYVTWDAHTSMEEAQIYIEGILKETENDPYDTYALGIALKENPDKVIGAAGIKTGGNQYVAGLAYVLSRKYWRQGIMYEVSEALIDHAFQTRGYKRISAWCVKENIASKSLMKKLGMIYEGCLRSKTFRKGRFWDLEYYSILKEEWGFRKSLKKRQQNLALPIVYVPEPDLDDVHILEEGVTENARLKKGMGGIEPFGFFIKDAEGQVLAGTKGVIFYGCLYTDLLWVSNNLRGKGLGTRLLKASEELAKAKGCTMATINTMDWEALDLYQRLGYQVDLARKGYKNDSTFYFLKKDLIKD